MSRWSSIFPDEGSRDIDRREFCTSLAAVAAAGGVEIVGSSIVLPDSGESAVVPPIAKKPIIDETEHRIFFCAAQNMDGVHSDSVDLVVTSPPYPMIEMWDGIFDIQSPGIADALAKAPDSAFELMHRELDKVWAECYRVLKDGGFMCVNIGDATRTINKEFRLYNNHSRIVSACSRIGFLNLPNIIWRKQTNAPNKFMGSGMLPCGAYVTLEHEWILVFRKGGKRVYNSDAEKLLRRASAFFWEERNVWFSDLWDVKGVRQLIADSKTRERNGSFPIEIPFRLINMYSQMGDVVLDPFAGMGTTMLAAMLAGRTSIGFEIDGGLRTAICGQLDKMSVSTMRKLVNERISRHRQFVVEREASGKEVKYRNEKLKCKVMTAQETDMEIRVPAQIETDESERFRCVCKYQPLCV